MLQVPKWILCYIKLLFFKTIKGFDAHVSDICFVMANL